MRHLLLATTFLLLFISLPLATNAEPKQKPELGSILDPSDSENSVKPSKTGTKDPFANIDKDLPSLAQTLRWELLLTQKAYGVTQNLRTTSDLITSLSKAVESLCFFDLQRSFFDDPQNRSEECKIVWRYLSDLDAKNPLISCLKFGIESPECRESYASQITLDTLPSETLNKYAKQTGENKASSYSFQTDLNVTLDSENNARPLTEILTELSSLIKQAPRTQDEIRAHTKKITDLSNRYLFTACSKYRIVVFPENIAATDNELPRQKFTPNNKKRTGKGSLEDLLQKGPFSQSVAPANNTTPRSHFRLVSKQCLSGLSSIAALNPNYPGIACYRDGFTAPTCIDARRARGTNTKESTNEGIERF